MSLARPCNAVRIMDGREVRVERPSWQVALVSLCDEGVDVVYEIVNVENDS